MVLDKSPAQRVFGQRARPEENHLFRNPTVKTYRCKPFTLYWYCLHVFALDTSTITLSTIALQTQHISIYGNSKLCIIFIATVTE